MKIKITSNSAKAMLMEKFDTTYECIVQGLFEMAAEECNLDIAKAYLTSGKVLYMVFDDKLSLEAKATINMLWEECIKNMRRHMQDI